MSSKFSNTNVVTARPTVSTTAYTSGDVVGGAVRLPRALGQYRRGVLKTVLVRDADAQAAALTLLLFKDAPTGIAADNAALSLSDSDLALLVGKVNVAASDYETVGGKSVAVVDVAAALDGSAGDAADPLQHLRTGDLWLVVVTKGTPTYTAADDTRLNFDLGLLTD